MAKKKVWKPNTKFINKLKARLQETPKLYDQGTFGHEASLDYDHDPETNSCGMPMCIGGHAYLLAGHTHEELLAATGAAIMKVAGDAMGLPDYARDMLFGTGWPRGKYPAARRPAKRVEMACAFIDEVVAAVELDNEKLSGVMKLLYDMKAGYD